MAKKAKDEPRRQKLKVFRTPIGFHDAYVAAPSQKAALEAWGSVSNLFASGAAEQVTEPELIAVPLARPGEVIKVLRGSKAEQVAALGAAGKKPARKAAPAKAKAKPPKPSRAAIEEAEEELAAVRRRHSKDLTAIERELAEVERRRRDLERRQRRELGEVEENVERERSRYERELKAWKSA